MLSEESLQTTAATRVLAAMLGATLLASVPASIACAAGDEVSPSDAAGELSLSQAVAQAIASNLDLTTQRQSLAAAREEIGLARSALLPQVDFGARGQYLDDERSDQARGNNKQGSFLVAAGVSQVVYDEDSWADFSIQKYVYEGQVKQLQSYEFGVIQDAANAFLGFDSARHELTIQQRNRQTTQANLEKSRARIAAGWSSEGEILRWKSQLAGNDTAVREAQVKVLQNLFELNRVRNVPPEAPVVIAPATIATYGFVYADEAIARAVSDPAQDRRMRDFLVRAGIARSPNLAALDASIAAGERQLTANRRAFWVPTLSFDAGIDYLANYDDTDNFNQTEWGVKGLLTFPVFEGGAKFASLDQARASLASLRTQRRATAQSLAQTIRATFAQATGSFESVGFARRQVAAASDNFELVDQSYTLGVDSMLDLLDAQQQLLTAELGLNDAIYGFLEDLIDAERAISFYAFIQPAGDEQAMVKSINQELSLRP